ncbi:MAG: hypothetical protein ACM65M_10185 [Microcoleus sp.]
MAKTPLNLYRQGNANSARMDNVRPNKDVATYEENGQVWVEATLGGGISTFATQRSGKNWWKLDEGTDIPGELNLVNDHNDHWLWKPSYTMPIDEYKEALRLIGASFNKVS